MYLFFFKRKIAIFVILDFLKIIINALELNTLFYFISSANSNS